MILFTEAGVYVKKGGKWRRYALAHFRYNNPFANGLAALAGIFMLFLFVYPHTVLFLNFTH